VLSPFLFTLVFAIIWEFFPPPRFPSHQTFLFRCASVWIIAFADDLAVACPSPVRLSRCLTKIKAVLQKLWLSISLKKTEVVTFTGAGPRRPRRGLPVRIGKDTLPPAQSFKYLGVTVTSTGSLTVHQRAIFSKAKVAGYEVAQLMRKLEIRNLGRLSSYMLCFVDSQFYGLELLPLHVAQNIDTARKVFMCTTFSLPFCTAKNLVHVLFPVMPSVFLLLKRRASFYERALTHDLECVREAFLFDMCQLFPHHLSWTFQLLQLFQSIGVDFGNNIASFPRHLREFSETMTDPELICFHCVRLTDEKTLSFFRSFPDVETAVSFRDFLSARTVADQDFLLLFLSSGLRWRFFSTPGRGSSCPCCRCTFWSWEHFLSCPCVPVRTSVPELIAMASLSAWLEVCNVIRTVTLVWLSYFCDSELLLKRAEVENLFYA
jgi:hypothetical protein